MTAVLIAAPAAGALAGWLVTRMQQARIERKLRRLVALTSQPTIAHRKV